MIKKVQENKIFILEISHLTIIFICNLIENNKNKNFLLFLMLKGYCLLVINIL